MLPLATRPLLYHHSLLQSFVAKQHPTVCFPLYAVVNHTPESVVQRVATTPAEKSSPQDCETTPPIRSTECQSPVRKATAKEKKTGTKTKVSSASTTATKCTRTLSDGYTIEQLAIYREVYILLYCTIIVCTKLA